MIEFAPTFCFMERACHSSANSRSFGLSANRKQVTFPQPSFYAVFLHSPGGRRKPNDLWILLLRILIFVLITLLLADPYWREKEFVSPQSPGISEHIFLLDSTPSMQGWGAWRRRSQAFDQE